MAFAPAPSASPPAKPQRIDEREAKVEERVAQGMFVLEKGDIGVLRREESQYRPSKEDIYVAKHLIEKDGAR